MVFWKLSFSILCSTKAEAQRDEDEHEEDNVQNSQPPTDEDKEDKNHSP